LYDIIGDIHGRAALLQQMLEKLAYAKHSGVYQHTERKAIFLGDFINKGPHTKEVLQIVRPMVEQGYAYAVVGNHELNLIGYFQKHDEGGYIRPHTEKNTDQHVPTFQSFAGEQPLLHHYIDWMKTLPLYLEIDGIRLAHAYWHQESIDFLQQNYERVSLHDALLRNMTPGSPTAKAVDELLVGLKLKLPTASSDIPFKTKWWHVGHSHAYQSLAIRPDTSLGNPHISYGREEVNTYTYPKEAPPFFFGHYNLPGKPRLLADNYSCLDYNLEEQPLLVGYRWQGEQRLQEAHLLYC